MKKKVALLVAAMAVAVAVDAQTTLSYDAQLVSGAYTEIDDGTVVPLGNPANGIDAVVYDKMNTPNTSPVTGEGYPIGFSFKYDNRLMNQFFIGAHGYLVLGKDSVSATCQSNPYALFNSAEDCEVLGLLYRSTVGAIPTTEISYKTTGAAPNRQLIVQYKDLQLGVDTWEGLEVRDTVQLQIRLHESGKIEFITKGYEPSNEVAAAMNYNDGFKLGIRGIGDDRLMKKNSFGDDVFSSDDNIVIWNAKDFPADGNTYTFTPPENCETPATQPTGLKAACTSLSVNGLFKGTDDADHYLVVVDRNRAVEKLPTDGTFYKKGDKIGDATVIAYTTDTVFESGDILEEATKYYVHVFAANSYCFYAPKFNVTSPLTVEVATLPAAPSSLEKVSADSTELTLSVVGNAGADDVLLAYTTVPKLNQWGQIIPGGTFGTPSGNYAVGDTIDGGGTVVYAGKADDAIEVGGLKVGTVYHLSAWSRGATGDYSSTNTELSAVTAGRVTWTPDLTSTDEDGAPIGWMHEGSLSVDRDGSALILQLNKADAQNGTVQWMETPDVYLAEGENRLVVNLLMTEFSNHAWGPYAMRDKDTVNVQVTKDGKEYVTVASYTKDNPLKFASTTESVKLYVPFGEAAGEKARLRIWSHVYGAPKTQLSDMRIEEKKACDYPVGVVVPDSSVIGSNAVVAWTSQGEEDAWEVRYMKGTDEAWIDTLIVRERKATLMGLESNVEYDVQVRARCSTAMQSDWSDTCSFESGLSVPFSMKFSDRETLSSSWQSMQGALATPTVLKEGGKWSFAKTWRGSYLIYESNGETADDWFLSPVIDLGEENANALVDFGISMNSFNKETSDAVIKLVVAADGKTFNEKDVVLTITGDDMPERGRSKAYTASLKDYRGQVRLGMYIHGTKGSAPNLIVDSLNVRYSCVNDIVAKVDTIGEDTAHVAWTSSAEEWLVFCREAGSQARDYVKTAVPELALRNLKPFTNYEVGLTKACEVGDTAKVKILELMTKGSLCDAPFGFVATPSKYSVKIEWQGEASVYNVRYRMKEEAETPWTTLQVKEPKIEIKTLTDGTLYEYAVQSQCGVAIGDTSAYSSIAEFTTLPETCFKPENIEVTPSYSNVAVTWTGEADSYEVACRKAAGEAWTSVVVPNGGYTIEGLSAQTAYQLRMRSICTEGDSSLWSGVVDFTTLAEPECVTPSNLSVTELTDNAALLSWQADESNLSWNLRYRESSVTEWTEVEATASHNYRLTELKANTAYVWRVQAVCEAERTSKWAAQNKFTTSPASGIDNVGIGDLKVFVDKGILNIDNPAGGRIYTVSVFGTDGRLIVENDVNTTDNVFFRLSAKGNVIVKIRGQKETKTYKTVIR